jgi:cytochrome c-type biogenesis protein CcmH/NrfG
MKRLGSAYLALNNREKALAILEKALRIAPEDSETKKLIRQLR